MSHHRTTFVAAALAVACLVPTAGRAQDAVPDSALRGGPSPVQRWAAPFAAEVGAPHGAGTVIDGMDLSLSGSRNATRRFQLLDRVVLTLPSGVAADSGTAVLLVRPGPSLGSAQVLVPTGIAVVESRQDGFVIARLSRVFGLVEPGHAVIAMPGAQPAPAPTSAADTRVAWIAGAEELPTLQSVVVLASSARDGVREGDRYELVGAGRRIPGGPMLPGTRAAVVRVIRVTEHGASAIVESQTQPQIVPGMLARPLARTATR